MDTAGYRTYRNPGGQFDGIFLLIIGFIFVVSFGLTACFDSGTEDAPPSITNTSPKGQDSQASEGQALFAANCAACHPDSSTIQTGNTAAGINAAIVNVNMMNGISLTESELQAIANFLAGNTGGGTGGSGTGSGSGTGGGTLDGQALYTANCAGCHGTKDITTVNDPSVSAISTALANLNFMSGVSVTAEEIQAISDYLTGGTGGGGSSGPPSSHTNPEDGIMHAPGNTTPFTSGCTVCHGAELAGGVGPSCFTCHGQKWNEGPGSVGSGTGSSGTSEGQVLYTTYCSGCHGVTGTVLAGKTVDQLQAAMSRPAMNTIALSLTELQAIADYLVAPGSTGGSTGGGSTGGGSTGGGSGTLDGASLYSSNCSGCHQDGSGINDPSVTGINTALSGVNLMSSISLTADEIQAISDFLTGNTGGTTGGGSTGGGTGTLDGQALYTAKCALCHGADAATINDPSVSGITAAMTSIGSMTGVSVTADEIQAISTYVVALQGGTGGSTGGGGSTGLPLNHTNSEEGVLHGEGNNTPYSSGCTACHGATLQGGAGPSCYSCHGVEWTETAPSGGGSGSTGGGTAGTSTGQTLYSTYCSACHGATGSGINGRTTSAITTALNGINAMSSISLTTGEIQAISDYLTGSSSGGSTGGSTGGGTTSSGPPASHTNPEDGILHAPGNNYPYTNGCTACHGTTLQGGVGPSCYSCHSQEWTESAPTGGGSTGGTGTGTTGTSNGQSMYTTYCAACHGATGASINGRTSSAITTALNSVGAMSSISLTSTQIQDIANYLSGSTGGTTSGGTSGSGGVPSTHTNSEQGVMHAPGNNYPFANGCTTCHGADLRGGVGPSCYSCHGQEWSGSSSTGGSSSGERGD